MNRQVIFRKWLKFIWGLVIYSFGVYCTINAGIGAAPWDVLAIGAADHLPVSYGVVVTVINIILVTIDWKMGERIGFGTIYDALLTGNFTDIWLRLNPLGNSHSIVSGTVILVAGLFIASVGMYFAMSAGQGCGPKDALLLVVGKRLPKIPIGLVQIMIFACALIAGVLLGGPVGFGTVISVACSGTALQIVFHILHYEPRETVHLDFFETLRVLKG